MQGFFKNFFNTQYLLEIQGEKPLLLWHIFSKDLSAKDYVYAIPVQFENSENYYSRKF